MGLFGKRKKTCCCGCGGAEEEKESRRVKVLGSGCARCNELEAEVKAALEELGISRWVTSVYAKTTVTLPRTGY